MEIKLKEPSEIKLEKDRVIVLPFFSKKKPDLKPFGQIKERVKDFLEEIALLKEGESRLALSGKGRFLFVNIGEKEKWSQRRFLLFLRKTTRELKGQGVKKALFILEGIFPKDSDVHNLSSQLAEGFLLAEYEFDRYKSSDKGRSQQLISIDVSWAGAKNYQKDLEKGKIIGKAVNMVRDLSNAPGGEMTPEKLAEVARKEVSRARKLDIEVFDEKKLRKLKMGGILGVSKGSNQKPRLIVLKYLAKRRAKEIDLVFVGKGITFDSGGLDIKPSEYMQEMHMDMSGAAAVLGAVLAIAKLTYPLNIVGLIPAAENMPSGQSYRPGDILKTYSGKTIEVLNTDAEGRIILSDALSFGVRRFKPTMIADVATLTGAAISALGQRAIALFTNLPTMENFFRQLGESSGDYVWPLPLWEEYEEEIKGTFGDIANVGKTKYGGAITAALFLKEFIDNYPWVHLDIAPTMTSIEGQGLAKGATGTGTRYLIKLAEKFPEVKKRIGQF